MTGFGKCYGRKNVKREQEEEAQWSGIYCFKQASYVSKWELSENGDSYADI